MSLTFSNATTPPPQPAFTPAAPPAPPAGQSFIMAAVGDGASGEANAKLVSQMIDSWNPNLFLYLGDVYEKGTYTEFYNWYGTSTVDYGLFRDVTNPAIGNHEYENGVAPGYFEYWNNPPNYYSYNAGGWHFIALNSTGEFNQTSTSSAQYKWLQNDLNTNTATCTIAYFHHPVLSAGPQGDTTRMWPMWSLLVQKGVDIVLTGHDHSYQRWVPLDADLNPSSTGVPSFVAGAGGHGVQGPVRSDSRLAIMKGSSSDSYGAMYFKLNPTSAEYRYVNTAGQILDQGVVTCSGATPDTTPPSAPTNLTATTSASGHAQLDWTAASDNTGVVGYGIYRDGALIASIDATTTQYVDTTVNVNVTYNYQVDAVDAAGNRSAKSNTATYTQPATATLVFTPTADAFVRSDIPTTNYGSSISLLADGSPDIQSFLRFNLQGLDGTVLSATLRVYANNGNSAGYQVYPLTSSTWDESTVTYATKPGTGSQVAASGSFASGGVWTQANLASLVTGNGVLDIALKTTSSTQISMSSREGANPPQLVVNVSASGTPPPTATNTPTATATATATSTATAPPTSTPTDTPTPTPTATSTPGSTTSTFTFTAVQDAYVDATNPGTTYNSTTLRTDASPDVRSFLRFTATGLPGPVTKATLKVYANSSNSTGYIASAVAASPAWSETSVTYSSMPALGPAYGASGAVSTGTWTQVDVTSALNGDNTYDFALTSTSSTATSYSSRTGANPPQLIIETGGAAAGNASALPKQGSAKWKLSTTNSTAISDASRIDSDGDGVDDATEAMYGSNPNSPDTDGDGLPDLWEIEWGISPTSAAGDQGAAGDPDHDGATNLQEYQAGTDPLDASSHS